MRAPYSAFADLPDDQLLAEVTRLATCERQATADLVASLVVLDARRLYLREGYPSLFAYCTGALHLAEGAAYLRIEAARAVRRFPTILDRLAAGAITLTGIKLLAPHLTEANHLAILDTARGQTTREIEQLVAHLSPRPDVPAVVRKLPARQVVPTPPAVSFPSGSPPLAPQAGAAAHDAPQAGTAADDAPPRAGSAAAPARVAFVPAGPPALDLAPPASASTAVPPRAVVVPLAPERYKVQMTIGAETHERLRRAQDLLRHTIPDGDLAAIFDQALVLLLEQLERHKWGARKARRAAAGDAAEPTGAHAEPRKQRRPASRDVNASGMLTAGATAGTAQPPFGGSRPDPATCPVIPGGEPPAAPAACDPELVAQRVRPADGHVVQPQPDTGLRESQTAPPACPIIKRGERPGNPGGGTELVAQRVRPRGGGVVQSQPDTGLGKSKTAPPACPSIKRGERPSSPGGTADELVARRVPAADGQAVQPQGDAAFSCGAHPGNPGGGTTELVAQRVRPRGRHAADAARTERNARSRQGASLPSQLRATTTSSTTA